MNDNSDNSDNIDNVGLTLYLKCKKKISRQRLPKFI